MGGGRWTRNSSKTASNRENSRPGTASNCETGDRDLTPLQMPRQDALRRSLGAKTTKMPPRRVAREAEDRSLLSQRREKEKEGDSRPALVACTGDSCTGWLTPIKCTAMGLRPIQCAAIGLTTIECTAIAQG
jgi:hypothetical protein